MSPSEIMILSFASSSMSVAFLDLSIENQKGGYIKPNQIKLLKYSFPQVAPLLSPSGILSPLGSLLSVPFSTFSTLMSATGRAEASRSMDNEPSLTRISQGVLCPWVVSLNGSKLDRHKMDG